MIWWWNGDDMLEIWRQLQMNQAQWPRLLLKAAQSQDCSFPSLWSQYVSYQSQSIAASISQPIDGKFRFHRHATMQELDESPDWTLLGFMITNACWEKACFCFWSILELRCTKEELRPDLLGFPNVYPAALRPRWEDLKMLMSEVDTHGHIWYWEVCDLTTLTPLSLWSLGALGKPYSKVWNETGMPSPPNLLKHFENEDLSIEWHPTSKWHLSR